MQLKTEQKDAVTVLHITGSLDAESVSSFKKTVYSFVEEGRYFFVMDCSHLSFIDSMGLGAMISLLRRVRTEKGDVKVSGLTSDVRSIFEITRLHHLFEIWPDWQSACQQFV